jgi:precorrin-6A/cobalt-precorrin-6A reductase
MDGELILLIGGTSETAPLAAALAGAGYAVLVSTATAAPLEIGADSRIRRRAGRLDATGLATLARDEGIRAIVDAAHPYAVAAHVAAREAAEGLGIPCLTLRRPAALSVDPHAPQIRLAADHSEAARIACAAGRAVLLTTGSRNLDPYAEESRRTGVPLAVRVLDAPESLAACAAAGIPADRVIAARGPFSTAENRAAIDRFGIGVVVTKESGQAGGLAAKLAAARASDCLVVLIRRPSLPAAGPSFSEPAALVAALRRLVPPSR